MPVHHANRTELLVSYKAFALLTTVEHLFPSHLIDRGSAVRDAYSERRTVQSGTFRVREMDALLKEVNNAYGQ